MALSIERKPIGSSNIVSVGHCPVTNTLAVEFKGGSVYHYHDVSADKHSELMDASSPGAHLSEHIKPNHSFTRQ